MVHRYYHQLSSGQQRTYRQSDDVLVVRVRAAASLAPCTRAVGRALAGGDPREVGQSCVALLSRVAARLEVPGPAVTVLAARPAGHWGELHGLYNPAQGPRGTITVWMRTATRGRVVAYPTFLRTLLHEFCHHLDFVLLGLDYSFHTTGFRKREASLYAQLVP